MKWLLFSVAVMGLFDGSEASASCVDSKRIADQPVGYDKIFIDTSGLPSSMRSYANTAAAAWNHEDCNKPVPGGQYVYEFPILSVDYAQGGGRNVSVVYQSGFNAEDDRVCGTFEGNTVTLYEKARLDGTVRLCTSGSLLLDTLAHEFGHLLGLKDQYDAGCSGFIMSQGSFTSGGSYIDRIVRSGECQKVAETNATPAERYLAECEADPNLCPPDNQCGYIPEYNWCSPIVLDLARDGFKFGGPDYPVRFDIDADSVKEKICWTSRRTEDAFLAMDRNGNGRIDDGSELFGDSTPFINGNRAQNGYQVLFELDAVRGNQNGFLDRGDLDFERLLLWRDVNHCDSTALHFVPAMG